LNLSLNIINQISKFKNNQIMSELSIEKMETVSGGKMTDATQCLRGIVATAALGATAFFAPAVFMGLLMTGAGLQLVATVSAAATSTNEGC
jgi:hypothetical protein